MSTRLLYVTDPMCSWCFGFAETLARIAADLREGVELQYVMGGLAQDDDQPMPAQTRAYIQEAWRQVESRTGASFEWSYWDHCEPRRSTWPACRAVLVAGDRGHEMFAAIQRAYYKEARDPSDIGVLLAIASELGFDKERFGRALKSEETQALLEQDFDLRDRLGARAFPSLGLDRAGDLQLLSSGWMDESPLRALLQRHELLRG